MPFIRSAYVLSGVAAARTAGGTAIRSPLHPTNYRFSPSISCHPTGCGVIIIIRHIHSTTTSATITTTTGRWASSNNIEGPSAGWATTPTRLPHRPTWQTAISPSSLLSPPPPPRSYSRPRLPQLPLLSLRINWQALKKPFFIQLEIAAVNGSKVDYPHSRSCKTHVKKKVKSEPGDVVSNIRRERRHMSTRIFLEDTKLFWAPLNRKTIIRFLNPVKIYKYTRRPLLLPSLRSYSRPRSPLLPLSVSASKKPSFIQMEIVAENGSKAIT